MYKAVRTVSGLMIVLCTSITNADVIDGEELIDPTRPIFVVSDSSEESTDVLSMIRSVVPSSFDLSFVRAGSSPIAVINQERVTIGDQIGGATVVSIERNAVTIELDGEERRISLYGDSVKVPAVQ